MPIQSLFMSPTAPFPDLTTPPRILRSMKTSGHLSRVFDTYLWHLRNLDCAVMPRLSMAAYAELAITDDESGSRHVFDLSWLPTYLLMLGNNLRSLGECFNGAYHLLTDFMEADGDFQLFAACKRAEDMQWFGYVDEADVSADGNAIVLRSELEALAPYQLATLLAPYFTSATGLGERIGASGPGAFVVFNNVLLHGFSPPAPDPASPPISPASLMTYPWTADQPMPTAEDEEEEDAVEEEEDRVYLVNKTLTATEVVEQLTTILNLGQQAAALFHTLQSQQSQDASGFRKLYRLLAKVHRE